ncbi:MAG: hypothetical protein QM803_17340 [Rhodocyclaceae bacterium]
MLAASAQAQTRDFRLRDVDLQKQANAVLALMGYQVVPDLTTSSLSIKNASTGNPDIGMSQLAGGFTWSRSTPLYMEGGIAGSRYSPTFLMTNGDESTRVPVKWNGVSVTAGVGWDFPTPIKEMVFRPIINGSYGYMASDLKIAESLINQLAGTDLDFINGGHLTAVGYGGSLMLDYEHYRPEHEIDVELRYTHIHLQSVGGSASVQGHATAQTLALWSRWRAPTNMYIMQRPVRYVLEFAESVFFGDQRDLLGFNYLTSFGVGLEFDSGKYDSIITRTRIVGRYLIGENVQGFSVGLAVSF